MHDLRELEQRRSLNPLSARGDFKTHIENNRVVSTFNVMPGKFVEEVFLVKSYRLKSMYGEATFDRTYKSSMLNSPDHLIFITGLIHSQKLLYAVLCETLGINYDPNKPEVLKIWPTHVNIDMQKMVTKSTDVVQKLEITHLEEVVPKRFKVCFATSFEDIINITSESNVYLI